jgi:hypothetical protein
MICLELSFNSHLIEFYNDADHAPFALVQFLNYMLQEILPSIAYLYVIKTGKGKSDPKPEGREMRLESITDIGSFLDENLLDDPVN